MNATPKQARYIVWMIEYHDSPAIKRIFENQPKNNAKYPDERADYRRAIFAETLEEKLNSQEVNFIINCLTGEYKKSYSLRSLMRLLFQKDIIPPAEIHPETGVPYDDD